MHIISAQDQTIEAAPGQKNAFYGTLMPFTTGQHTLIFRRVQTGCLDTMLVRVICTDCPPVHNNVPNGQNDEFLWNIAQCAGDTLFCTNLSSQDLATFTITDNGLPFSSYSFCGNSVALRLDTGYHMLYLLDNASSCEYNIKVQLTCSGGTSDSTLLAVQDIATTFKNAAVEIPLLVNDIILGITGNTAGLQQLELISNPPNGSVTYDDFLGVVTYTPNDGFCGADTFSYRITDVNGQQSTAQVRVTVVCDKVLVYNGISPNNDGKNDVWHIVGIEQFPNNEVRVFNRWGNLVFEAKSYDNQHAWGGTWNGSDLPDGAYFYMIDLGDGSEVLSGYLQLMR
jgi:gliding motility-associated-like protein